MAERYDYYEAVQNDVREYIKEEISLDEWRGRRYELEDMLNETLFNEDSVTGNASGSYTFNIYKAEENLCHNWDLLADAIEEFGGDFDILRKGAEACDVTIRCHLLSGCISDVLDELEEDGTFDEEEEQKMNKQQQEEIIYKAIGNSLYIAYENVTGHDIDEIKILTILADTAQEAREIAENLTGKTGGEIRVLKTYGTSDCRAWEV